MTLEEEIKQLYNFRNNSWKKKTHNSCENMFLSEACGRLVRINLLYLRYLENEKRDPISIMDFLILDGENFYYQTFRFIRCLEKVPEFSNKLRREFPEITKVRNLLIEHSGEQTDNLSLSYCTSKDVGLQVKPQNAEHKDYEDNGIKVNFKIFKTKLKLIINNALLEQKKSKSLTISQRSPKKSDTSQ